MMPKPTNSNSKDNPKPISGEELIDRIAKSLRPINGDALDDASLAKSLGMNAQTFRIWRETPALKSHQVANLVAKAVNAAKARTEREALKPIVEFYRLEAVQVGRTETWELFSVRPDGHKTDHPYRAGLRKALEGAKGIYVLYNSSGRALYVGKTVTQSLWIEMNFALNRTRSKQVIRRVSHPESRRAFESTVETRQIRPVFVKLHELAYYCSAYQVSTNFIGEVESLLIRGFANDLSNLRMEKFGGGLQESDKSKTNGTG